MSLSRIVVFAAAVAVVAVVVPKLGLGRLDTKPEAVEEVAAAKPAPEDPRRVALSADRSGHFFAQAVINGHSVQVMVDTGATYVAFNEETARRLGVRLDEARFVIPISTANGVIMAAAATIDEIKVGGIRVRDVPATIVRGKALSVNLLGMSFLNKLRKFEIAGGQLVLMR